MPTLCVGRSLTNDGLFTYVWNVAGQLVGVENVTVTIVYTYNGDGVRVAESTNGIERLYVQDVVSFGLPQVLVETTQQPNGQTIYLYGLGRLAQFQDDAFEWFLGDALGSVWQLVDDAGEIVLAQAYDPYGQVMSSSGTSGSGYGYTGEQDANAGLVFLRARYLAPDVGRFLSQDQWPGNDYNPSSLHVYIYVWNNPILFVDPSRLPERTGSRDFQIALPFFQDGKWLESFESSRYRSNIDSTEKPIHRKDAKDAKNTKYRSASLIF